jgi:hypothetical protein
MSHLLFPPKQSEVQKVARAHGLLVIAFVMVTKCKKTLSVGK